MGRGDKIKQTSRILSMQGSDCIKRSGIGSVWVVEIRSVREGTTDSVGSERLEGSEGENCSDPSRRAFQAEGTAHAKPLRLDSARHVGRPEGRPCGRIRVS